MLLSIHRAVAQWVSVHVWGTWGRRFESAQPELVAYSDYARDKQEINMWGELFDDIRW